MIRLGSLRGSLGHLILNTLNFFLNNKNSKDILIIATPKKEISNYFVYKILINKFKSQKVFFNNSIILKLTYKILNKLKKKFHFLTRFTCNIEWLHHDNPKQLYGSKYNFDENFYNLVPDFEFEEKDIIFFSEWKKKKNINKKFVCISSRDPGFYEEQLENPRNFNFEDYDKLIRMLLEKNYIVIRMGRKYRKNFNFASNDYIELYQLEKNNSKLDIIETFLFKECEFIISGNSGIDAFAALFKKKIFITNNFPAGRIPRYLNCTFIPKVYSSNNRIMNFNNIPKKILLSEEIEKLEKEKINLINANSKDIENMVREYLENKNYSGIDISKKSFVIEGKNSNSSICPVWYSKNKNLFNNEIS